MCCQFVLGRRQAEEMFLALISSLGQALSPEALTTCVEALNEHLIRYPSCKALMWQVCCKSRLKMYKVILTQQIPKGVFLFVCFQEKVAVTLLRRRRVYRDNQALQNAVRESLALIGYVDPVKGRGIRVLSIDGGGTR